MRKSRKWMAIVGVGLTLVALTAAALPVAAQNSGVSTVAHGARPGGPGQGDAYLAEALGITDAELAEAQQAAYEAGIDQALAEGLITEAQAEALKERDGVLGHAGGRELHGFLLGPAGSEAIDAEALLAGALGISVDQLAAARVEATDLALAQAVEDGRITQEDADMLQAHQALRDYLDEQGLQEQVRALYEQAVQEAVQAGVVTQAQADAILSGESLFPGMGRHGGFPGRGGMRGIEGLEGFGAPGDAAPSRFFQRGVGNGSASL